MVIAVIFAVLDVLPHQQPSFASVVKQRLVKIIDWFDHGLDISERWVLVLAILAMAAVSVVNVSLRNLTGSSLLFADDATQLLLVVVTFMGLALGARQARHIRVSAIHDLLPPRAQKALLILTSLITAGLLLALSAWALDYAQSTQRSCRVLPETWTLAGITLRPEAIPPGLSLGLVVVLMALIGRLLGALPRYAQRLRSALAGWAVITVIVLGGLVLILGLGWLKGLAAELIGDRSGSCRVMPSTGLPVYLLHLVVPLGLVLAAFQFALAGLRNLISQRNYLSWHQPDAYAPAGGKPDG